MNAKHQLLSVKEAAERLRVSIFTLSPDNSFGRQKPGGTGFPACAKNTLLFQGIYFNYLFQIVVMHYEMFMNKAG